MVWRGAWTNKGKAIQLVGLGACRPPKVALTRSKSVRMLTVYACYGVSEADAAQQCEACEVFKGEILPEAERRKAEQERLRLEEEEA